jgi:hypothetical protein
MPGDTHKAGPIRRAGFGAGGARDQSAAAAAGRPAGVVRQLAVQGQLHLSMSSSFSERDTTTVATALPMMLVRRGLRS